MAEQTDYVKWFRNSAPYINAHRDGCFLIVLSGETIAHPNFANIVHDIALLHSLGVKLVLVHGARPQIEAKLEQLGFDSQIHRGLRVTDQAAMQAVIEANAGVKTQIEALLSMGLANSPMHGADIRVSSGNFVTAKPIGIIDGVDMAHTGQVRKINGAAINDLLAQRQIVLLSTIGYSPTGEVFNLPLDSVALHTAQSVHANKFIEFIAEQGLLKAGQLLRQCLPQEVLSDTDKSEPHNAIGLNAAKAVERGVERAHLVSYAEDGALLQELFSRDGAGTLITQQGFEQLHTASIDDIGGILEIIEPLEQAGVLVKRSREQLEMEIEHFRVIERDGMIVACAALYPFGNDSAEIACVATHPDYRGKALGERLLQSLESEAKTKGIDQLFVLTTQTAHWFQEQGFAAAEPDSLPSEKAGLYNFQRRSKVFIKALS